MKKPGKVMEDAYEKALGGAVKNAAASPKALAVKVSAVGPAKGLGAGLGKALAMVAKTAKLKVRKGGM